MKIDERWIGDRDRWKEEGGVAARAAPNAQRQSTLTLTLSRERARGGSCCSLLRRLAAGAAVSSSLVLVCAHPLVLPLSHIHTVSLAVLHTR